MFAAPTHPQKKFSVPSPNAWTYSRSLQIVAAAAHKLPFNPVLAAFLPHPNVCSLSAPLLCFLPLPHPNVCCPCPTLMLAVLSLMYLLPLPLYLLPLLNSHVFCPSTPFAAPATKQYLLPLQPPPCLRPLCPIPHFCCPWLLPPCLFSLYPVSNYHNSDCSIPNSFLPNNI